MISIAVGHYLSAYFENHPGLVVSISSRSKINSFMTYSACIKLMQILVDANEC